MVVVDTTPVRQTQIDLDDAMARRLQEGMDSEFAVGLANNPHKPFQDTVITFKWPIDLVLF